MALLPIMLLVLFNVVAIAQSVNSGNDADGPLDLTAYLERGEVDKARKLSAVDPTLFAGVQSHAAFFIVNKTNDWHNFFWFFPAENKPLNSTPWILWLGSGCGYSSLFDLFQELGPLQFENGTVSRMSETWSSDYSLLFIDNPVKAGFSYFEKGDKFVENEEQGGESLLSFIQQFIQVFPELQKAPLFIGGQLFGGRFGLALGRLLHQNSSIPVNLKGFIIGSNWLDPPSYLYNSDFIAQLGFMELGKVEELKLYEDAAGNAWKEGNVSKYLQNYGKVIETWVKYVFGINPYKFTEDPYDISAKILFQNYLNQSNIRSALHVGDVPYKVINSAVLFSLAPVFYLSVKPWFEEMLEHYGILCYSGQLGLMTSYTLAEHMYQELKWSGQEEYLKAERKQIQSKNPSKTLNPIGYVKGAGNFMEVMIRSAADIIPSGQPVAVKQVVDMFIEKFK